MIRKGELEAEKIRARDRGLESGLFKVGSGLLLGGAYLADKAALGGTTAEGVALAEADPMQLASAANAINPNGSVDTNKVSLFKKKASGLSFDDLLTSFADKSNNLEYDYRRIHINWGAMRNDMVQSPLAIERHDDGDPVRCLWAVVCPFDKPNKDDNPNLDVSNVDKQRKNVLAVSNYGVFVYRCPR